MSCRISQLAGIQQTAGGKPPSCQTGLMEYAGCAVECDQLDSPPRIRGAREADAYSNVDVDGDVGCIGLGALGLAVILITKDYCPSKATISEQCLPSLKKYG